ncbi:peroxidase-like [Panonychus citri]|uniref:peroxidase-like n=1 Tax=Panonychus citri TaxID=50023 RepID=UPI0023071454|nr:peroxidase-like [Panonychus citri]
MKFIGISLRITIALLVLMSNNLLINGHSENESSLKEEVSSFSQPLEQNESTRSAFISANDVNKNLSLNITEVSVKTLIGNHKKLPLEPTVRTRSSDDPVTRHVPINIRKRSTPTKQSSYKVRSGIKSKLYYDQSELYWKSNSSLLEKFHVRAFHHDYLGELSARCRSSNQQYNSEIKPSFIVAAVKAATERVDKEIAEALENAKSGNIIASNIISADGRHLITGKLPEEIKDYIDQEEAQYLEYVAKNLQERMCIRPVDVIEKLTKVPISSLQSKFLKCSRNHGNFAGNSTGTRCKNSRYRAYDGFCNNLRQTFWGKSNICHVRFLPPYYEDGIYLPRSRGVSGQPLPSPRTISLGLHESGEGETYYTPWHFTWGQYVIHDIMSTPQSVPSHGSGVQCCSPGIHDESKCMPIMLSNEDLQASSRKCINFIRSAPCPLCSLGPRQQTNLASSYIDQSAMYGGDNQTVASLRTFRSGLMKTGRDRFNRPILPDSKSPLTDQCSKPALGKDKVCFGSGDFRVNQQPFIQMIHLIFVRRHNQHASGLARVNPRASDEILFQEARRLTIAELQHITYNEYLPVLLGSEMSDYFNIIEKDTLFSEYEQDIDATTWNECAAAACRFGHSQVTSFMAIVQSDAKLSLKDSFFDPKLIHSGLTPNLIATFLNGKSAVIDPFLTSSLKNYLYFHSGQDAFGSDLAAFNIQRGRDHGIAPYTEYVKFCFGYTIRSWNDLVNLMPRENVQKLRNFYQDFRDIDLFTGGLYEKKATDADIGPTFACIVGIQFYHLKFGDRYFYSHKDQAGSFTTAQLLEIKNKVSLAALCVKRNRN